MVVSLIGYREIKVPHKIIRGLTENMSKAKRPSLASTQNDVSNYDVLDSKSLGKVESWQRHLGIRRLIETSMSENCP